ncbi:MAG: hypothetical protein DME08_15255 [Candidatus Rokuibacteriota bacterium]|nr:MAG: hypothetical protein DME08_15255 [Candidatus Rokubacteria bacterium]
MGRVVARVLHQRLEDLGAIFCTISLILSSVGRISWPAAGPAAKASSATQIASPDLIDKIRLMYFWRSSATQSRCASPILR